MENYDVLRKVGEGTFGEVFLAKHKATGQLVRVLMFVSTRKCGFSGLYGLYGTCLREFCTSFIPPPPILLLILMDD